MSKIKSCTIYPLKSGRGIEVDKIEIGANGIKWDRHWMVVNEKNSFVSQRTIPKMALIDVELIEEGLRLNAPGMPTCTVPLIPKTTTSFEAVVWKNTCQVIESSPQASDWVSQFLGSSLRIVSQHPESKRPVKRFPEMPIQFCDRYPLLITTESSLNDLNDRLGQPVEMQRFRPNIVLSGDFSPYEEDNWNSIQIGDMELEMTKPCGRCSVITIDPKTGLRGTEPLKTLSTYRKQEKEILFGRYAICRTLGTIQRTSSFTII